MWSPFSMLNDHHLFRNIQGPKDEFFESVPILIQLTDINGRVIQNYKSLNESLGAQNNSSLADGIYFLKIVYEDGKLEIRKTLIYHR